MDDLEKKSLLRSGDGGGLGEEESSSIKTSLHFQDFTKGYHSRTNNNSTNPASYSSYKGYRALDDVLDEIGEGKFQYLLLALMSAGDFIEAGEMSLHGILLPLLQEEFNLTTPAQLALVGSLTGLGMILGSSFFAFFSNTFGRRMSFQSSLFCCFIFCLVSSFCMTIESFALARFGLGFGYGGNMVSSTTLLTEFTPTSLRAKYMNVTNIAFALGAICSVGMAWGLIPLLGFRWLLRIVSLMAIPLLIVLPFCPESPRFLIMRGRHREAVQVLERVARINHVVLDNHQASLEHLMGEEGKISSLSLAKLHRSWRTLVPLALVWFLHSFSTAIFGFFPLEIARMEPEETDAAYKIALVFSFGSLLGMIALYLLTSHFGRLSLLRAGLLGTGLFTALIGVPIDDGQEQASAAYVYSMGFLIASFSALPIAMLYLYTPEVHPTETRTIGFGICMLGHRLAPIAAPFLAAWLNQISFTLSCAVFGALFWCAALLSLFLRVETFGNNMVEIGEEEHRSTLEGELKLL